ncbi:MAG: alginate export family protein [Candidatus Omnitrophota bacterium]
MNRKIIVALVALSFALMGTTFAAVENIKVSGDMNVESILRNLSLGSDVTVDEANDHGLLISQIRLRFDADLTENVSAALRLISEDTWGEDSNDDIEIDLGYVELKEFLYQPLSLCVGRQELKYGNGLIVGNPDTNQGDPALDNATSLSAVAEDLSLRKSFQAIKATLDLAPFTVDVVLAQVDEVTTSLSRDDEFLYGVNVAYDWDSYNGISELYFFGADNAPRTAYTDESSNVYTLGARTQLDPTDKISLGLEGAFQFGNYLPTAGANSEHRRAFAFQTDAEYKFLNDYNVKLGAGYTFLSGNKESGTDVYEGWDPLWEDQTPAEIINILMENSNVHLITASASMMPREDVTLGMLYAHAQLANKLESAAYVGTSDPNTATAVFGGPGLVTGGYVMSPSSRSFGDEIDAYACYDYTEDVQLVLKGALFMPGGAFSYANNQRAYSLRAGLSVDF